MNFLRLLPVFLSFMLIAAHFYRSGPSIVAVFCILAPVVLCFSRPWSVRVIQFLLVLATIEWVRTLLHLVQLRQEDGLPWVRLAVIIGGVALFTACSALLLQLKSIQRRYNCIDESRINYRFPQS